MRIKEESELGNRFKKILSPISTGLYRGIVDEKGIIVNVQANDYYDSEYEYDFNKKIKIDDTNEQRIMEIDFKSCYSRSGNGGSFQINLRIDIPANGVRPADYHLVYSNYMGDSLTYEIGGVKYCIMGLNCLFWSPGLTVTSKEGDQFYTIIDNVFYKEFTDFYVGIDMSDGKLRVVEPMPPYKTIEDDSILVSIDKIEITKELRDMVQIFKSGENVINSYPAMDEVLKIFRILEPVAEAEERKRRAYEEVKEKARQKEGKRHFLKKLIDNIIK